MTRSLSTRAPRWGADACVRAYFFVVPLSDARTGVPRSCATCRDSRCAILEAATGSAVRSLMVAWPFPPPSPAPPFLALAPPAVPEIFCSPLLRRPGRPERGIGTSGGARHADFPCGQLPVGPCCLTDFRSVVLNDHVVTERLIQRVSVNRPHVE